MDRGEHALANVREVTVFLGTHIPAARARLGKLPVLSAPTAGVEDGEPYVEFIDEANSDHVGTVVHRFPVPAQISPDELRHELTDAVLAIYAPHN